MTMQRREFLKTLNHLTLLGLASGIPGVTLLPSRALAGASGTKRFFVLIRASGGWDVTLGLEPRIHSDGSDQNDIFIEYRPDEILKAGDILLGPSCQPILPYASDIAVINGIFMSDANISHEANFDYISTGDAMGLSADVTVEASYATETGPFGVIFNTSLKRASRALMPTTVSNLESLRSSTDFSRLKDFLAKLKTGGDYRRSQLSLLQNTDVRKRLISSFDALKNEIERPGVSQNISSFARDSAVVAAAFKSGAASQAQLDLISSLDTHSAHPGSHLTNQRMVWEGVANIFRIFKNVELSGEDGQTLGSLFDHTTFCVVSEFARTPALNSSSGKDHNPLTNSVLLAGAGVNGGTSFGASRVITRRNSATGESRHCASPVDYATGTIARTKAEAQQSNFQFIFPENVVSTLAEILKVDRSRFASVRPEVPSIPSVIKARG